ncbi:MAG: M56 family metallopeptidase [Solirubrobacterales bacterium]
MIVLAAVALAATLGAPHLMRQGRIAPAAGIGLWLSVLCLRAVLALSVAVLIVLYLPATQLFGLLTHWCFHAVIPFVTTHLGFSGHRLGDVAILVPALVAAVSLLSTTFAAWRATRAVRRWLSRSSVGSGPEETVLVGGEGILLAAAGLRDPKVVVSAGALCALDEPELRAGLEHERGHIARRHRFYVLFGNLFYAVSRLLPGSASAWEHLQFHLERDADEYAVKKTGDPLALASVICKAATSSTRGGVAFSALGGGHVSKRLDLLLEEVPSSGFSTALARGLAVGLLGLVLALVVSAPALASVGIDQLQDARSVEHLCRG